MSVLPVPLRVLVADADEPTRNLVVLTLSAEAFDVAEATTATEAIRRVAAAVPDVVLVDVDLPDAGGLAAARALKVEPRTRTTKVILLTDLAEPVSPGPIAEAGVDAVLSRPFGAFALMEAIERVYREDR